MSGVLLESRPFRPFKSSEEYLYAMKEDLAEWLQTLYPHLRIATETFMERLETGVALCEHANAVKLQAKEYVRRKEARRMMLSSMTKSTFGNLAQAQMLVEIAEVKYKPAAKAGTFFARDNLSNFIGWCRDSLRIIDCLLFESDDLIMRKNEKHVILCLLEVARRGAKFGMLAPMLIQMERQIDREIKKDDSNQQSIKVGLTNEKHLMNGGDGGHGGGVGGNEEEDDEDTDSEMDDSDQQPMLVYGPAPQIVTNDLKSLDEMVRDLVEKCSCATQFPMIRVSEGKYRIGDTKVLIFVRILRNHVMVRVGGGWDTLSHYLDKHDPCRCRTQHRAMQSAKLVNRVGPDLAGAQVIYDRSSKPIASSAHTSPVKTATSMGGASSSLLLGPPMNALNRSRSKSPTSLMLSPLAQQKCALRRSPSPYLSTPTKHAPTAAAANHNGTASRRRSRSPPPNEDRLFVSSLKIGPKKSASFATISLPNSPYLSKHQQQHPSQQQQYQQQIQNQQQNVHQNQQQQKTNGTKRSVVYLQLDGATKSNTASALNNTSGELSGGENTDHSDNASELSDEGYRSLGLEKKTSNGSSVDDADEPSQATPIISVETNESGLRCTPYSNIFPSSNESSPKCNNSSSSNSNTTNNKSSSINATQHVTTTTTWDMGGRRHRRHSRPALVISTSSAVTPSTNHNDELQFKRNNGTRRSLSSSSCNNKSAHNGLASLGGGRRGQSANTSPEHHQRRRPSVKEELIRVVRNADDNDQEAMLEEVKKLLKRYGSLKVEQQQQPQQQLQQKRDSITCGASNSSNEDFSESHLHASPNLTRKRKDSKPENALSKIPAPMMPF